MNGSTAPVAGLSVAEHMLPRLFRVVSTREETYDTTTLELEPEDGQALPFLPGQYTMLYVFGVGEVPISISGDPGRPGSPPRRGRAPRSGSCVPAARSSAPA